MQLAKQTRATCGGSGTVVRGVSYASVSRPAYNWPVQARCFTGPEEQRAVPDKAGRDLLEYLLELETEGRGYHLVGHSHGGSVILLAEPSFISGLQSIGDTMTGQELVPTSYFDHGEVLDLLAANMAWAAGTSQRLSTGTARSLALWGWFRQSKQCLGVHVADPEPEPSVVV